VESCEVGWQRAMLFVRFTKENKQKNAFPGNETVNLNDGTRKEVEIRRLPVEFISWSKLFSNRL